MNTKTTPLYYTAYMPTEEGNPLPYVVCEQLSGETFGEFATRDEAGAVAEKLQEEAEVR